ncbi:MAG: hypothetical protein ACKOJI_02100 [Phycisphaerales bacterium]
MKTLSEQEAYAAMYAFLERWYRATGSDDVAALLGSMATLPSGGTVDPALWVDWLDAIEAAKSGSERTDMNLE